MEPPLLRHLLDIVVSFGFVTLFFAMIYKFVPDVKIQWKDVWIGAALTSILFTTGKFLIGLYLGSSGVSSAYGAAGSLITVLLWVFYSSLIFLLVSWKGNPGRPRSVPHGVEVSGALLKFGVKSSTTIALDLIISAWNAF